LSGAKGEAVAAGRWPVHLFRRKAGDALRLVTPGAAARPLARIVLLLPAPPPEPDVALVTATPDLGRQVGGKAWT